MLTGNEDSTATVIDQTPRPDHRELPHVLVRHGERRHELKLELRTPRNRHPSTSRHDCLCAGLFQRRLPSSGDGHQHCRGHELFEARSGSAGARARRPEPRHREGGPMSKIARLHHHLRGVHPVSGRHLAGNLGGGLRARLPAHPRHARCDAQRRRRGIAGFFCGPALRPHGRERHRRHGAFHDDHGDGRRPARFQSQLPPPSPPSWCSQWWPLLFVELVYGIIVVLTAIDAGGAARPRVPLDSNRRSIPPCSRLSDF